MMPLNVKKTEQFLTPLSLFYLEVTSITFAKPTNNNAKEKAGVDIKNNAFKVQSETDLKKVLYAMDQRYYYADIYEENRVASSVRVITNSN